MERVLVFDAHAEDLLAAAVALFAVLDEAKSANYEHDDLNAVCHAGVRFAAAMEGFAQAVITDRRRPESN